MSIQQIHLLKTIAAYKTKDHATALILYNIIIPAEFHFNSKKYAAILFAAVSGMLKRRSLKSSEALEALIKETGFMRLKNVYSKMIIQSSSVS
jgi:hypothetical protein